MLKAILGIVSAATVIGAALMPATASAAVITRAATGPSVDTVVTFAVTSGLLTITAPDAADLGSGAAGTTISHALGAVRVTDDRADLSATWTVTASSTDFTTGGTTAPETIPATDATYTPGQVSTAGTAGSVTSVTPATITLSGSPQTVLTFVGVGDNTAAWDPTIAVAVPAAAVNGTYTATLTQSVTGGGA